MEHRNGARSRSTMHVTLLRAGHDLGNFPVLNVSTGGLALQATLAALPQCCLLTVRVGYGNTKEDASIEARVLLVHQRSALIGLMWIDTDLYHRLAAPIPAEPAQAGTAVAGAGW